MKNIYLLLSIIALLITPIFFNAQNPCAEGTIIINGDAVDAVSFENNNTSGLKLPLWLEQGSTISTGDRIKLISVIEFSVMPQVSGNNTLEFSQVKTIGNSTEIVPLNKVWKIESVVKFANAFAVSPVASSNSPICETSTLHLTTSNVSGATYSWTGPNGFVSNQQNPVISNATIANAGTYNLTITSNGCTSSQVSTVVVVNTNPSSNFSVNPSSPITNQNSTFTPVTSGLTSYTWTFTSGSPLSSGAENPVVQWSNSGNYNVSLSVADNNACTSTTQKVISVIDCTPGQPSSSFTYSPLTPSEGQSVTFTPSLSGQSYQWSFTGSPTYDGGTSSVSETPQLIWAAGGTYNINLTVTDNSNCFTNTSQNIVINSCPSGTETFNYTGVIESWTVPSCVNQIIIEVYGAQGGNWSSSPGGYGAKMKGTFSVTPGETLWILSGGQGQNATSTATNRSAGGGGGTFVTRGTTYQTSSLIIAAGGGGGAAYDGSISRAHGKITADGSTGGTSGAGYVTGTAGIGGAGGGGSNFSGAGAGWFSNGGDSGGGNYGKGGKSFHNGGAGGLKSSGDPGGDGGFGGGGGAYAGGGGGGGYSGGAGGSFNEGGGTSYNGGYAGGGGSYNNGTNQDNASGVRTGNGLVIINY